MTTQDQAKLLEQVVTEIRATVPGVLAIYRFGTWGRGDERAESDIDLAILPVQSLAATTRWQLAQHLAAVANRDVDLVDLRSASTVMAAQVIANGVRLFCSDENACAEFEDFVYASYARLNEERRAILSDIQTRGSVYGG